MKRLFICFIILAIIFAVTSCNHVPPSDSVIPPDTVDQKDDRPSEPPNYNFVEFFSLDEFHAFVYGDESEQMEWICNKFDMVSPDDDSHAYYTLEEIKDIYKFTLRVTGQPIPTVSSDDAVRYIDLKVYYGPWDMHIATSYRNFGFSVYYPCEEHMSYIKNGDLKGYYKKAHPIFPLPDSYDKENYLRVEMIYLERTDMESQALLVVPKIAAPYVEFIRNGLIIRITNFYNYGSLDQAKLIELANALEIIDVTQESRE